MNNPEKGPNIFRLSEHPKRKVKGTSTDSIPKLNVSDDGYLIYPKEEKGALSIDDALVVANEVIVQYEKPDALLKDFMERELEKHRQGLSLSEETLDFNYKESMEKSFESQREMCKFMKTENIILALSYYKKEPGTLCGTYVYAMSLELRRRLGGNAIEPVAQN